MKRSRPRASSGNRTGLLPVSGSEPTNFEYYKGRPAVNRNNCMAFAFGERGTQNYVKQQPGNKSGLKGVDFSLSNCKELVRRVLRDYPKTVYATRSPKTRCKAGYSKVMAFLAPGADFHFFRQGPNGYWEHKRGLTPPSKRDACDRLIKDPIKACRDYGAGYDYKVHCSTFCRKSTPKLKGLKKTVKTKKTTTKPHVQRRK